MMPPSPALRPRPGRQWRRRHLAGVSLAAALALGGDLAQPTAAENALPATGHAQVIAQAVLDLSDASLAWTVKTIDARENPASVPNGDAPGFLLGTEGAAVVHDETGARARLSWGEALPVRPDEALTI